MGEAGGGKADAALSDLAIAGGVPRTDGGAKPIPERGLTAVPFKGIPFEGTGPRLCILGLTWDGDIAAARGGMPTGFGDRVVIGDLAAACDPAADGIAPR